MAKDRHRHRHWGWIWFGVSVLIVVLWQSQNYDTTRRVQVQLDELDRDVMLELKQNGKLLEGLRNDVAALKDENARLRQQIEQANLAPSIGSVSGGESDPSAD